VDNCLREDVDALKELEITSGVEVSLRSEPRSSGRITVGMVGSGVSEGVFDGVSVAFVGEGVVVDVVGA
jgi:hypothetical protein